MDHEDTSDDYPFYSGRSLSLVGILGGDLFILLLIAFITCIRQRKRYRDHDVPINNHLSNHLRRYLWHLHASQEMRDQMAVAEEARVPPPDYVSVIKLKEKEEMELPSYSQAVRKEEREEEQGRCEVTVMESEEVEEVEIETEKHEGDQITANE